MPRIDIALVYTDGRREVVKVGRPADLIAFADKYDRIAPSEPYAVAELAWLAHRALKVELPLDEWVESLDELTSDDEQVEVIRAELEEANPDPSVPAEETPTEEETPTALSPVAPLPTERGIESHG